MGIAAVVAIGALLAACGRTPAPGGTVARAGGKALYVPASPADFKVALVMSGSIADNGWNEGAYRALQAVQQQLKLSPSQVSYKEEATSPSAQSDNLQAFASQGYNLIFGHGEEYESIALNIESQYPKSLFVISSGSKVGANTMPIVFRLEDGAYLLGMLAAGMSKTGILGEVGAQEIPPLKSVFAAFEDGARAYRPSIRILPAIFTNDWDDPGKAKQATLPLISSGADVIVQDLDNASQGVFRAVEDSSRPGKPIYALGTNSNQNSLAPAVVLASAPIHLTPVFVSIARDVENGTLKPTNQPYGIVQGVVGFVLNPALESRIPPPLLKRLKSAQAEITAGRLVPPRLPQ